MSDKFDSIDPEIIKAIKDSVLDELRDDEVKRVALRKQQQERDKEVHDAYITKMKASTEPWVDIATWSEDDNKVDMKLNWNDAFIVELRDRGFSGASEEQLVQQYLAILAHNASSDVVNDEEDPDMGEFQ